MTNYYPHRNRMPFIEHCLFNAFKDEYAAQEKSLRDEMRSGAANEKHSPFAYESFNLGNSNQSFMIGESALFSETTSLLLNMYNTDKDTVHSSLNSSTERNVLKPISLNFRSNDFDVMQIDTKMSFSNTISFIHKFYTDSPGLLYGVLLHNGSKFINPLHPLVAQSMIKSMNQSDDSLSKDVYKVIVYTYKDKVKTDFLCNPKLNSIFLTQILNTLAMLDVRSSYSEKIVSIDPLRNEATSIFDLQKIVYRTDQLSSNSGDIHSDLYMQPVQLINSGIVSPYYGIVAEKYPTSGSQRGSVLGYQLSPMMSCNVGKPYTVITKDGSIVVEAGSVCTGIISNSSHEGRMTLNHANLSSPYFQEVMGAGSYTFADTSIMVSLSIYAELFGLTPISLSMPKEIKIPISFLEYKKTNPSASLSEYIIAMKQI